MLAGTGLSLWQTTHMKAVQINFSEDLLARFDADELVRELGRSEVVRRIAEAYLHRRDEKKIAEEYARGYGPDFPPIEEELEGWTEAAAAWREP